MKIAFCFPGQGSLEEGMGRDVAEAVPEAMDVFERGSEASGLDLHRFRWIEDEAIGELPLEWNWLVGEYSYRPDAKVVHYTLGGPYFEEYRDCDYAAEWFAELEALTRR